MKKHKIDRTVYGIRFFAALTFAYSLAWICQWAIESKEWIVIGILIAIISILFIYMIYQFWKCV